MQRPAKSSLAVAGLLGATIAAFLSFQSCGAGDDDDAAKKSVPKGTAVVGTEHTSVDLDNGTVADFPTGSLPAGGTLSVQIVPQPAEFAAATGLVSASSAIEVSARGAGGEVLSVPSAAGSIAIFLEAAPTALLEVKLTDANLCVFGLTTDKKTLVYRRSALASVDVAAKKVTFLSPWFGIFQIVYCGEEKLAGFAAASANGMLPAPAEAASYEPAKSPACENTATTCIYNAGSVYDIVKLADSCKAGGGTPAAECKKAGALGVCVAQQGTTNETATYFYAGVDVAAEQANCEKFSSSFVAADAYVPTVAAAQVEPKADAPAAEAVGLACDYSAEKFGSCLSYSGSAFSTQTVQLTKNCDALKGVVVAYDQCPTAGLVGICVKNRGRIDEALIYHYEAAGTTAETLPSVCAQQQFEVAGAGFAPTAPAAQTAPD